jgi:hypothetical protein
MISTPSPARPSLIPFILKIVGIITIAASLIDYAVMLVSPQFGEPQWRYQLVTQVVDRGVVPLIGVTLVIFGLWAESAITGERKASVTGLVTLVISGLLGLVYLGCAPLIFGDSGQISAQQVSQLNSQAAQAEQQLVGRLQQEKAQISQLIGNDQQLQQIKQQLNNGQVPPDQKQRLEQIVKNLENFKKDPKTLDTQQEQAKNRALSEIRGRQEIAKNSISTEFRKSRIRISLGSLLLSGAFLTVCVSGFQGGRGRR